MLEPATAQQIISFLLLLICAAVASVAKWDALDCTDEGKASVTLQLNASHIVRTWQPSTAADCPWFGSLHPSSTLVSKDRILAETTEPPLHWLVMELRRPMLLDRVSLQGENRDSSLRSADSPVSVLVSAGLPLELQLQNSCSASWVAFNDTRLWRQLSDAAKNLPVSFILLTSREKILRGQTLEITGRLQQVKFGEHLSSGSQLVSRYSDAVLARPGDFLDFFVSVCEREGGVNFECWLEATEGERIKTVSISKQEALSGTRKISFELEIDQSHHDTMLKCGFLGQIFMMQKLLATVVPAANWKVNPPSVCIAGRKAVVEVWSDSYPEPIHKCKLIRSGATEHITLLSKATSVTKDWIGRPVIRQTSQFELPVTRATRGQVVRCDAEEIGGKLVLELDNVTIREVSDPCVTDIDLGTNSHWRDGDVRPISVRSHNCSVWNVSHSCWIVDPGNVTIILEPLVKIQQEKMSSSHSLNVTRWMGQRDWLIRCSVNQSGFEYADIYSLANQRPEVFYIAKAKLHSHSLQGRTLTISLAIGGRPKASKVACRLGQENSFSEMQLVEAATTSYQTWKFQSVLEARRSTLEAILVICSVQQFTNGLMIYETSLDLSVPLTSNITNGSASLSTTKTEESQMTFTAIVILGLLLGLVVVAISSVAILLSRIIQRRTVAALTRREQNSATLEQRNQAILQPAYTLYANLPTIPAYPWDTGIYCEEETTFGSSNTYANTGLK